MRVALRKLDEEIVEDSEPEREAARQASRASGSPEQVSAGERRIERDTVSNSVIDISDDSVVESSAPLSKKPLLIHRSKDFGVIDLSDSSIESTSKPILPSGTSARHCCPDDESDMDDSFPSLRLSKFVHISTAPRAGPSKPRTIPSVVIRQMSTSSALPAQKSVATNVIQRLTDEFPSDSMSRLLMCVCCDSVWTTRKSVPQKLTHIKACAKKQGINEDTLVAMVRKGIENAPPIELKGKGKATAEASASKTFFDEVVQDAAPKKRTRRQEVTGTVKDIGETRDVIMLKARTIVARGNSSVRAIREHRVGGLISDGNMSTEPSSTPRFGKSRLAGRLGVQAQSMFNNDGEQSFESSLYSPPFPSSPTGPPCIPRTLSSSSKVESAVVPQILMDLDAHNLETPSKKKNDSKPRQSRSFTTPLIYVSSEPESSKASPVTTRILEVPSSPPLTPSPRKRTSLTSSSRPTPNPKSQEEEEYTWNDEMGKYTDEAYLHYEPEQDIDLPPTPSPLKSPRSKKAKAKSRSRSPNTSPTALRRKKKVATAGVRDKLKLPDFDEEWDKDLRDRIIEDTTLYLRILRFEPVHFNVFLSMVEEQAATDGRSSAKLKFHLREFLDKQAINFYGAEPVGRRKVKK